MEPKAVEYLAFYLREFHGDNPNSEAYVFYSRNGGLNVKMSQSAVNRRLKLHAAAAHCSCSDVPLDVHAHQLRHARASHWLEEGVNIVQISLLLGHANLETTMIYLDITLDQKLTALITVKCDSSDGIAKKWKNSGASLAELCGVKKIRKA